MAANSLGDTTSGGSSIAWRGGGGGCSTAGSGALLPSFRAANIACDRKLARQDGTTRLLLPELTLELPPNHPPKSVAPCSPDAQLQGKHCMTHECDLRSPSLSTATQRWMRLLHPTPTPTELRLCQPLPRPCRASALLHHSQTHRCKTMQAASSGLEARPKAKTPPDRAGSGIRGKARAPEPAHLTPRACKRTRTCEKTALPRAPATVHSTSWGGVTRFGGGHLPMGRRHPVGRARRLVSQTECKEGLKAT